VVLFPTPYLAALFRAPSLKVDNLEWDGPGFRHGAVSRVSRLSRVSRTRAEVEPGLRELEWPEQKRRGVTCVRREASVEIPVVKTRRGREAAQLATIQNQLFRMVRHLLHVEVNNATDIRCDTINKQRGKLGERIGLDTCYSRAAQGLSGVNDRSLYCSQSPSSFISAGRERRTDNMILLRLWVWI
jgi:hypothetical protein